MEDDVVTTMQQATSHLLHDEDEMDDITMTKQKSFEDVVVTEREQAR